MTTQRTAATVAGHLAQRTVAVMWSLLFVVVGVVALCGASAAATACAASAFNGDCVACFDTGSDSPLTACSSTCGRIQPGYSSLESFGARSGKFPVP